MVHASVTEPMPVSADEVWKVLADFGDWSWAGIEFQSDGSAVGAVRTVPLPGTEVVERCEVHDPDTRTIGYAILQGNPFPVHDYHATMSVVPKGDDASELEWSSTFEADDGADPDEARQTIEGFYRGVAGLLRAHLTG